MKLGFCWLYFICHCLITHLNMQCKSHLVDVLIDLMGRFFDEYILSFRQLSKVSLSDSFVCNSQWFQTDQGWPMYKSSACLKLFYYVGLSCQPAPGQSGTPEQIRALSLPGSYEAVWPLATLNGTSNWTVKPLLIVLYYDMFARKEVSHN